MKPPLPLGGRGCCYLVSDEIYIQLIDIVEDLICTLLTILSRLWNKSWSFQAFENYHICRGFFAPTTNCKLSSSGSSGSYQGGIYAVPNKRCKKDSIQSKESSETGQIYEYIQDQLQIRQWWN